MASDCICIYGMISTFQLICITINCIGIIYYLDWAPMFTPHQYCMFIEQNSAKVGLNNVHTIQIHSIRYAEGSTILCFTWQNVFIFQLQVSHTVKRSWHIYDMKFSEVISLLLSITQAILQFLLTTSATYHVFQSSNPLTAW